MGGGKWGSEEEVERGTDERSEGDADGKEGKQLDPNQKGVYIRRITYWGERSSRWDKMHNGGRCDLRRTANG